MKAAKVRVSGRVQRTGYRWFVVGLAHELGLLGYVELVPDGSLLIHVQGGEEQLQRFIERIRNPPPPASIKELTVTQTKPESKLKAFTIKYGTIGDELQEGFGPMQLILEEFLRELKMFLEEFKGFAERTEKRLDKLIEGYEKLLSGLEKLESRH